MKIEARSPIKSIEIEAVIIRADGRIEPVGTLAYWHQSPLMRGWHRIKTVWRQLWHRS